MLLFAKILTGAGILFLVYYLIIIIYAGISADFAWFWVVLGGLFLLMGCGLHNGFAGWITERLPAGFVWFLAALPAAAVIIFCALLFRVLRGMRAKQGKAPDYVIVLGAQIKGKVPSKSLIRRLDRALKAAEEYPAAKIIVSGGRGPGEDITEAECMMHYLTAHKTDRDRVIAETRSATTFENLRNVLTLEPACAGECVAIITNDFHIYRSVLIAKHLHYENVYGIPAASVPVLQPHFAVRECFALLNEYRKGFFC